MVIIIKNCFEQKGAVTSYLDILTSQDLENLKNKTQKTAPSSKTDPVKI